MARGAAQAQRKRQAQPQAKRKQKRAAPSWEEQLFFSRLRRHAKVIYVLLAVAFAAGFVLLGVGSGSTGIGDILNNLFRGGSSNSVSSQIKDDQKKIAANPNDMSAYIDLAGLYRQKQDTSSAIATLEKASKIKPKNVEVLTALAGLYRNRADQARNNAQVAYNQFAAAMVSPPGLDANSTLGQALTSDPLSQALKTKYSDAYAKLGGAFGKAEKAYQRQAAAARGTSNELNAQSQLASVAEQTYGWTGQPGDAKIAIAAYRRYLKLEPSGVQATLARQKIAQLSAALPKGQR
jgi:cytochrome c-type biogenesis protein CcmH/NrfG